MSKLRVLVVGEGFIAEGVEVRTAEESSVLEAIQEFDPQVVVMDVRLADMLPAVRAESGQNVVLVALGEEQGRHNGWDSGFHLFFTSLADAGFRQELRNLKRSADLAGYRRRERLHLRFRRELRPAG